MSRRNSNVRGNGGSNRVVEDMNKEVEDVESITLKVLYEDPDVVVFTAPNEDELREIVLNMLREGPKTLKDMHSKLAGIASEDKIRRCLVRLMDDGIVTIDDDGKYKLLGTEDFDGEFETEMNELGYF
ncbi:MAG: ArsR family transcriptional regulator [Ignisphaera sp.]